MTVCTGRRLLQTAPRGGSLAFAPPLQQVARPTTRLVSVDEVGDDRLLVVLVTVGGEDAALAMPAHSGFLAGGQGGRPGSPRRLLTQCHQ